MDPLLDEGLQIKTTTTSLLKLKGTARPTGRQEEQSLEILKLKKPKLRSTNYWWSVIRKRKPRLICAYVRHV